MMTASFLVLLGVLSRLLPHAPNAVALGATALYAGARLPRRWAILVPLAILALSDMVIDLGHGYQYHFLSRASGYAIFAGLAFIGTFVPKHAGALTRVGMSIVGSTLFFVLSNFAVWAEGSGLGFPLTPAGLVACYAVALPFYWNTLGADLLGTGLLFGADALAARLGFRTVAEPESSEADALAGVGSPIEA
ncbi:MAG: DUF6580 family putative transport protein [Isosphaeraceae bacterium]